MDSSIIFNNLEDDESVDNDTEILYTVLEDDTEVVTTDVNIKENTFLDSDNVFYLSLKNDDIHIHDNDPLIQPEEETNSVETCNINMELLEQITLADGTQAFIEREPQIVDSLDNNLLIKSDQGAFEITDENGILLQNFKDNFETVNFDSDSSDILESSNIKNNLILTQATEEDISEGDYQQIQLDDGSIAIIDKSLYSKLFERNGKTKESLKNDEEQGTSSNKDAPKTYKCEQCDKSYSSCYHLRVHMRNHNGQRPYKCDVKECGKTFITGYSLKAHHRTHTGEKPYGCLTCSKRFKTSGDLQKHIRIHTGEKPFMCPIEGCGRSFTTSNIRKVHIRSHTGERPYKCPETGCNKAFASATNYKNHIRIHSGEKPYVCHVQGCAKRFTEYSSLYKHQTVHKDKRSFTCEYCARDFRQQSSLVSHKRNMHNIIVTHNGTEIMVEMQENNDLASDVQNIDADGNIDADEDIDSTSEYQLFFVTQSE